MKIRELGRMVRSKMEAGMTSRKCVMLGTAVSFVLGGAAIAAQQGAPTTGRSVAPVTQMQPGPATGTTTGLATGQSVLPTTVIQKEFEGRSVAAGPVEFEAMAEASAVSAGVPGVEAKPGTQAGRAQFSPTRKPPATH